MSSPNHNANFSGFTTPVLVADNIQTVSGKAASTDGLSTLSTIGVFPNSSPAAIAFEIQSTSGGVLFPRMTEAQRDAQNGFWLDGTIIYNITDAQFQLFQAGTFIAIGTGGGNVVGPGVSVEGNIATWNNIAGTLLQDSGVNITQVPAAVGINTNLATVTQMTDLQIIEFSSLAPNPTFGAGDCAIGISDWSTGIRMATVFKTDANHGCLTLSTAIPPATPNTSTIFSIEATDQTFLNARMNTTQVNALTAVDGMQVYDTVENVMKFRQNGVWSSLPDGPGGGENVFNIRTVAPNTVFINVLNNDYIIEVNTFPPNAGVLGYGCNVVFPYPPTGLPGQSWVIKDARGSAGPKGGGVLGGRAIFVYAGAFEQNAIDNGPGVFITEAYGSVTVHTDGSNYYTSALNMPKNGRQINQFTSLPATPTYSIRDTDTILDVFGTTQIVFDETIVDAIHPGQSWIFKKMNSAGVVTIISAQARLFDNSSTLVLQNQYSELEVVFNGQQFLVKNTYAGISGTVLAIRDVAGNAVVLPTDYVVNITDTSVPRSVTLPNPALIGESFVIKDGSGGAGTNSITITPTVGLIDGAANAMINTNYGSLTFVSDGANYYII